MYRADRDALVPIKLGQCESCQVAEADMYIPMPLWAQVREAGGLRPS